MEIQEYLEQMKKIQKVLLEYIDDEENNQEKFKNLIVLLNSQKTIENKHLLTSIIHLIASIIYYHYRSTKFYEKIFNIIKFFKDEFKKHYSNLEIFNFFQNNKKVILFLSEEKIISIEKLIQLKSISSIGKYLLPEIKPFIHNENIDYSNLPENIEELRKIEYGDNSILQLIEKDLINEFIIQINQTNLNLEKEFYPSIFETNLFIAKSYSFKLMEYSAFFGSVKIFKYLVAQKCFLSPNLWLCAIHGRNPEIIHILEDSHIIPDDESYRSCLKFAIICHHYEIANYILSNYINDEDISSYILKQSLKSYNFDFIQSEMINSNFFFDLCKRDYFVLASYLLQNDKDIDINTLILRNDAFDDEIRIKEKTALHCAIEKGNFEIVQFLLGCKYIDINKKSIINDYERYEIAPLLEAIENGNMKIIRALLDCKDIDINIKSKYGKEEITPLCATIKNKNIEVFKLLIKRNDIDINLESTIFNVEIDQNRFDIYQRIAPLFFAVELDNIEIIQLLLNHKDIDINTKVCIKIDHFDISTNEKTETIYKEETALYYAVTQNKIDIVRLLLSQEKIDINIKGKETNNYNEVEYTLLYIAVCYNYVEIVKMLLENKNINVNSMIINYGKFKNDEDIWSEEAIEFCKVSAKKDVFGPFDCSFSSNDIKKYNSLYMAVMNENIEIVQLLLKNENIDVNMKSYFKSYSYSIQEDVDECETKQLSLMTPLYLAIEKKNNQIAQLLIEHEKIDINIKSFVYQLTYKRTFNCQIEGKQNVIDKTETALHNAVSIENIDIIKLLLNHKNINTEIIDKNGEKPIKLSKNEKIHILFKQ